MNGKRVLVSGASGFIGRWAVPPLLAAGYEVHAVGRGGRSLPPELHGAEWHRTELLDAVAVEALVAELAPSHLLHFAWIATPGVYWNSPENRRWLEAGTRLLQSFHAHGGVRAVMAGSCAEYDWTRAAVCVEGATPLAAADGSSITDYARCKLAMHATLERFGAANHVSTAWGRVFFQYGPDEHPDRLVASVIGNLLRGREALCSSGTHIRSFLHVADVGAAFAALLDSRVEGPVNIGGEERISIAELLQRISAQIGRPELVRLGARPTPAAEPPVLVPSLGRLRNEVGWRPHIALDAGLADSIGWWRERLRGASELPA